MNCIQQNKYIQFYLFLKTIWILSFWAVTTGRTYDINDNNKWFLTYVD